MADPVIASAPQAFTFGVHELKGNLVAFRGAQKRRSVSHQFGKRDGARVEDMGRAQRELTVDLVFTGATCAADFAAFQAAVDVQPQAKLTHPTAGTWIAFCEGPEEDVAFARATNEILVRVSFKESEDPTAILQDIPDVSTAVQNATLQQAQSQIDVAGYMGTFARAGLEQASAIAQVNTLLAQVSTVTDPLDFMLTSLATISGIRSSAIGALNSIVSKMLVLSQNITDFVNSSMDLFTGGETSGGAYKTSGVLLGMVISDAKDLQAEMIATSLTPAGPAEAIGSIEESVATCLELDAAVLQSRPPIVSYTLPRQMDVITLARVTLPPDSPNDILARASVIMGLNRFSDPGRIPAGTIALVPSS